MQVRSIARELALLTISQLPTQRQNLDKKTIDDMVIAAVRSLTEEVKEMLATASAELQRGQEKLLNSHTRAADIDASREFVNESITLTQTAINRVGIALDFPQLFEVSRQTEIRAYTVEILHKVHEERAQIDAILNNALIDWQLKRLAEIDRQILRIAVADMVFLGTPHQIAINEAVELAKRYSVEDGYRFINGVLRSVRDRLKAEK
ncbi:transcription antitermination factor NusB [Pseudanabaena sp. PCC 6802]|uniref:transcription antitermination factor NusB n=1 Tax=Pseudanabaena sp. PCC 6802 TaxID=118173 RepID=UPI00034A8A10|nr:transcription antitermination factor NusB [Pseudanabaena sp. PCC 6802]